MIFFNIIILFIVFFFQSIFPAIYFLSFKIYPDFLLIILLYFSSNNSRFTSVLIGFCIGFIQDLIVSLTSDLEILNKEYSDMIFYSFKSRSSLDKLGYIFSSENYNQMFRRLNYIFQYSVHRNFHFFRTLLTY